MSGYIHSKNEWNFTNLRLENTMRACGTQLCIQRPEQGPIIHIKPTQVCHSDLLKIDSKSGEEVFKVSCDGAVFVNGLDITNNNNSNSNCIGNVVINSATVLTHKKITLNVENENDGVYLGNPTSDGCWKFTVDNHGDLIFMKKINGVWTMRYRLN